MKHTLKDLGPVRPTTPEQQEAIRALLAHRDDADELLEIIGSGEW